MGVTDGVEEHEGLVHLIGVMILDEDLIVTGDGDEEEEGGDILEAVDPLFPLTPLAAHIEHTVGEGTDMEEGLGDTGGLDPASKDILVGGDVLWGEEAIEGVEEVLGRVIDGTLISPGEAGLDPVILPESTKSNLVILGVGFIAFDDGDIFKEGNVSKILRGIKLNIVTFHGFEDGAHGVEEVGEDDNPMGFSFKIGEAFGVDEAHLFEDG